MKTAALSAVLAGLVFAPLAQAESELYVTGGYAAFDGDGATLNSLSFRGGVALHDLLGAEFEAAFGLGAKDVDGVDIELENQFGGYLVGRYPVGSRFDVLGRLGYTTTELQGAVNGVSTDVDADGFAFGLGGEFEVTESFGIRGDYTRIQVDEDEIDGGVNILAITAVYRFGTVR